MTKPELIAFERAFQADVSSAGPIFAIGTVVGFVVGMLISYQITYTDVSDQLPQYATLKAIGYPTVYLLRVVLEQAALERARGLGSRLGFCRLRALPGDQPRWRCCRCE